MPSFPRRRESCLIFKNYCKNNLLIKFGQDSRLRGNDDDLTISYFILGFAKVSGCLKNWAAILANSIAFIVGGFLAGYILLSVLGAALGLLSRVLGAGIPILLAALLFPLIACTVMLFAYLNAYASFADIWGGGESDG